MVLLKKSTFGGEEYTEVELNKVSTKQSNFNSVRTPATAGGKLLKDRKKLYETPRVLCETLR